MVFDFYFDGVTVKTGNKPFYEQNLSKPNPRTQQINKLSERLSLESVSTGFSKSFKFYLINLNPAS